MDSPLHYLTPPLHTYLHHFLTPDSPLLFWMGASLFFAVRTGLGAHWGNAVLAEANKYNGLGVCGDSGGTLSRPRQFYADLDAGCLSYCKSFEASAVGRQPLTYPVWIDFLADRIVILQQCEPD